MSDQFGLSEPSAAPAGVDLSFLDADNQPTEAPQPTERPEDLLPGPEAGQPAPGSPEASQAPQTASQEDAPVRLWANKYRDPEALEKGYREQSDLQRRTAQRAKGAEEAASRLQQEKAELEVAMQRAIPALQQAAAERQAIQQWYAQVNQAYAQQAGWGEQPSQLPPLPQVQPQQQQLTPDLVSRIVDQRVNQVEQQIRAEYAAADAEASIMGFYENHPEVEVRGEVDGRIANTVAELHRAWAPQGVQFDIGDPDMIELAYEASQNEGFKAVLVANPRLAQTEAGLELARRQAGIPAPGTTQQIPAPPPAQMVAQRKPVTERASTGGNPEGADKPLNEFQQAIADYRRSAVGGLQGSVFG